MRSVRVAILGAAHPHMPDVVAAVAQTGARVLGVWDPDPGRAQRWAGELGAVAAKRPDELLGRADLDCALVLSETSEHLDLCLAVLEAGKPLFVEKPLALEARSAQKIAAKVKTSGLLFDIGYFLRDVPAHAELRRLVKEGELGEVVGARGEFGHPGGLLGWFDDSPWITDPDRAGFGALGDLGIHLIDLLTWVTGRKLIEVCGSVGRLEPACPLEQFGESLMRLEGGALASLSAGWTEAPMTVSIAVRATRGTASVVDGRLTVRGAVPEPQKVDTVFPAAQTAPIRFLESVRGPRLSALVDADTAADHVRILQAIYDSARQGRWVSTAPGAR